MVSCQLESGNETNINITSGCFTTSEVYQNTTVYCHEDLYNLVDNEIMGRWIVLILTAAVSGLLFIGAENIRISAKPGKRLSSQDQPTELARSQSMWLLEANASV